MSICIYIHSNLLDAAQKLKDIMIINLGNTFIMFGKVDIKYIASTFSLDPNVYACKYKQNSFVMYVIYIAMHMLHMNSYYSCSINLQCNQLLLVSCS